MKRLKTSDSMSMGRTPNYPLKEEEEEEHTENNGAYSKEFLAMLDSYDHEDYGEEIPVKKRRLSLHQVKALEVSFEAGNKLDPVRKVKLAEELSLEPRQVAIWFQNRRARWKNRQLDRDYGILRAKFDALKHDYDCLERQNRTLAEKLKVLKAKACGDSSESSESMKDESPILVYKDLSDNGDNAGVDLYKTLKSKDCSSDSGDSVGAMKEESTNNESSLGYNGHSFSSTSMVNCLQYTGYHHQTQFVRMDEQSLFTPEESYNFFSVDQAPSLHWLQ